PRETRAVSPRRGLGEQRRSDAHELERSAESGETDVVGRHAKPRAAKQSLGVVDRFPALVERCEVPATAAGADDPEPSLSRIERQAPADGEGRQKVVGAEIGVAEETGSVHASSRRLILNRRPVAARRPGTWCSRGVSVALRASGRPRASPNDEGLSGCYGCSGFF